MGLIERWPVGFDPAIGDLLVAAYGDPARGYHDLRHLAEVLDHLDELGGDEAVRLAAWFHDAVYDPTRTDNEEGAARLAERLLAGTGVAKEVARLVRVTRTHRADPDDLNGRLLCDADLAILGADPSRYADYVAGVRREYADLDDQIFDHGRSEVLRELLARPSLFQTAEGRERWEATARANIAAELAHRAG